MTRRRTAGAVHAPVSVLLVLAVALAGCTQDPGGDPGPGAGAWADLWSPDACDPSGAGDISRNAPVLDAYRGTPEEVARRFAEALGEELPPYQGADNDGRWHEWSDGTVQIQYRAEASGLLETLGYATADVWPSDDTAEGTMVLRTFLDRFGVSGRAEVSIDRTGSAYQLTPVRDGEPLANPADPAAGRALPGDGSGEPGHWSSFDLRPIHDVRDAEATHSEDRARETAKTYMRCVMDRDGRTAEEGWTLERVRDHRTTVRHESLAHAFQVDYDDPDPDAHCDHVYKLVYVDAATGAVLADGIIGCD